MAQIRVRNLAGNDVGSVDVSNEVFAARINEPLVHQAVVQLLANQRLGTHKAKTRSEVSGGGAKPWRQKGTGRARQGSRVSPLWRGGGIVFGPAPRGYRQYMPKKMRRSALRCGLSSRLRDDAVLVVDTFALSEPRTREMAAAFEKLGLSGSVVVVDDKFDHNASLASRNIPDVELCDSGRLNLLHVLRPQALVFTRAAIETVDRRLSATSVSEES